MFQYTEVAKGDVFINAGCYYRGRTNWTYIVNNGSQLVTTLAKDQQRCTGNGEGKMRP